MCHGYIIYGCNKIKKGHIHSWGNKKSQIQACTSFRELTAKHQRSNRQPSVILTHCLCLLQNTMTPGKSEGIIPITSTIGRNWRFQCMQFSCSLVSESSGLRRTSADLSWPGYKSGLRSKRLTSSASNSRWPETQCCTHSGNTHLSQNNILPW